MISNKLQSILLDTGLEELGTGLILALSGPS